MATELPKQMKTWSNAHLLEQFHLRKSEYSEEALGIMAQEIADRGIGEEEQAPYRDGRKPAGEEEAVERRVYPREEFAAFDHLLSPIDLILVRSMFMDAGVPFFVDNPQSERVLPIESQASQFIRLHVHRDFLQQAHDLLDEHFVKDEGAYKLKYSDPRDRLRAFTFNEIGLSEAELYETVDVSVTAEEAAHISRYARRLIDEIEKVEAERTVFFFDNLEELLSQLKPGGHAQLSRALLLTILEVLQIYCDDPQFPASLDEVITGLLGVFAPPRE